jgi:DNA-binding transcriptional ArsR family regulator
VVIMPPSAEGSVFASLSDPMRRRLVRDLAQQSPRTATQLAEGYPISRQGVLKHLHVLRDAGLVTTRKHGREARYSLATDPLVQASRWIRDITTLWDQRLLRLKAFVEEDDSGA